MMLHPLPSDPQPTDVDIEPYLNESFRSFRPQVKRRLAEMAWQLKKTREDPNLFAVPYSRAIRDFAGFPDYESYRRSPLWRSIRRRVLSASNHECAGCQNRATQVHHRDYRPRVLAGEDLTPLVPVCRECHKKIEDARRKVSWQEGECILHELVSHKDRAANNSD
jgi:5-methylcytosine-specific restriction endonuclease McrA